MGADDGRENGYTPAPHCFFDVLLPLLGFAELKITLAIMRETIGWHKRWKMIAYSEFEKATGLGREAVRKGIVAGMERGTIDRKDLGGGYAYSLRLVGLPDCPVGATSQVTEPGGVRLPNREEFGNRTGGVRLPNQPSIKENRGENNLKKGVKYAPRASAEGSTPNPHPEPGDVTQEDALAIRDLIAQRFGKEE